MNAGKMRQEMQQETFRQHVSATAAQSAFSHLRKPKDAVRRLVDQGVLLHLCRGQYVVNPAQSGEPLCLPAIANALYGPSYVSFHYALSRYGMIPERVTDVTSATRIRSRRYQTAIGVFSYFRMSVERFAPGISRQIENGVPFLIASPEKALLDTCWQDLASPTPPQSPQSYFFEDLRLDAAVAADLDVSFLRQHAPAFGNRTTAFINELITLLSKT